MARLALVGTLCCRLRAGWHRLIVSRVLILAPAPVAAWCGGGRPWCQHTLVCCWPAAQAGARVVYAVEASNMAHYAKQLAAANPGGASSSALRRAARAGAWPHHTAPAGRSASNRAAGGVALWCSSRFCVALPRGVCFDGWLTGWLPTRRHRRPHPGAARQGGGGGAAGEGVHNSH